MIPVSSIRTETDANANAAFVVTPATAVSGPLVFASPHSGADRPEDMAAIGGLSLSTLRSAEDVGVDQLVGLAPSMGIPVIAGRISRAYLDLNRAASELDPALIADLTDVEPSAKVSAGFGVIPRRAGDGSALYDRRLTLEEATGRLERVHAPYHRALADLMQAARDRHGAALLIDWHSMPSRAAGASVGPGGRVTRGVDIILGDRHGAACRGGTTRRVRAMFEAQGWQVGLNAPYAGGYSTQTWGRPADGFQAIQVEINRALYLNEATLEPSADHRRFAAALGRVIKALASEAWPG